MKLVCGFLQMLSTRSVLALWLLHFTFCFVLREEVGERVLKLKGFDEKFRKLSSLKSSRLAANSVCVGFKLF